MFSEKAILSIIGVIVGFILSQLISVLKFLMRARFNISHGDGGVLSYYSGNPPEEDAEVIIGFLLQNSGRSTAREIRVFVNLVRCWDSVSNKFIESASDPFEIRVAQDILLPGKHFSVHVAKFTTSEPSMMPYLAKSFVDHEHQWYLSADTRGINKFELDVWIICDDPTAYNEDVVHISFDEADLNPSFTFQ